MSFFEPGRTGDVGALAHVDEGNIVGERERFEPRKPQARLDLGDLARRIFRNRPGDGCNVLGRRSATAAYDVQKPVACKPFDLLCHEFGALVILAELVGQARIGIGADQCIGDIGNLAQMGAHGVGAQRAVEPDGEGLRMAQGIPEGSRGLARKRAAGQIGDRTRNHHRQADALLFERFFGGKDRRLGVERIEDRFDQDQIRAAIDQPFDLLAIGDAQLIETGGAIARIVHVRRNGRRAVGRPDRPGHKPASAVFGLGTDRGALGGLRPGDVELIGQRLHAVIGLGDGGARKRVGLQQIRARHGIGEVDIFDELGFCDDQKIVIALQRLVPIGKPLAAEVFFRELFELDHCAHGAVENEDTLARRNGQRRKDLLALFCRADGARARPQRLNGNRSAPLAHAAHAPVSGGMGVAVGTSGGVAHSENPFLRDNPAK